jgi:phytoene dehydrogenase-like protein
MKKVIIAGAGIAGLSAGCFLQMNGYETEIFEMHSRPGGLCQAWKRKDYTIDGCIHWFCGCNPSGYLYKVWNSLVDMKSLSFVVYDEFCSVEHNGKKIRLYADVEKLQQELKDVSPEDSPKIDDFIAAIRQFDVFQNLSEEAEKAEGIMSKAAMFLKMAPSLVAFRKWKMPLKKYAERFKSEKLRHFFTASLGNETPVWVMVFNSSWFNNKDAAYLIGGANELAGRIVKRYESLGGKIHYNSKVTKIVVEDDIACGIKLENGEIVNADVVISAADGFYTVQEMLGGKYRDKHIDKLYYSGKFEPKTSGIHIAAGVARTFNESFKPIVVFDMKNPITVDGKEIKTLGVTVYNFDPGAAPKGHTVLTAVVESNNPSYWINLRNSNKQEYDRQKDAIAGHVIDEFENHFGNIKNNLKMVDVATPATYVRYTNNRNGALMGWTDFNLFINKPKKEIRGLKNFYMCGQWTGDAGLPGALISGREVTRMICRKDEKKFEAITF